MFDSEGKYMYFELYTNVCQLACILLDQSQRTGSYFQYRQHILIMTLFCRQIITLNGKKFRFSFFCHQKNKLPSSFCLFFFLFFLSFFPHVYVIRFPMYRLEALKINLRNEKPEASG